MWGNISEDVKGAGELKIFQGTHVFSNGHKHENTAGDVLGDFHGVCSRGV